MRSMCLTNGSSRGSFWALGSISGLLIWLSLLHTATAQARGKYAYFARENSSSVLIKNALWDVRGSQLTQFSFRTCSDGEQLYQRGSSGDFLKLVLVNGTLQFHWSVGTNQSNTVIGTNLNNDHWWTISIQRFLGNLFLNVTQSGHVYFSEIISNSTFRTYFTTVNFTGTQGLYVGRNFTGCIIEGPTVIFLNSAGMLESYNVTWSNTTCSQHDATCAIEDGDINDCYSHPCNNGATCIDKENAYECVCPHLYNGTNCQNDLSIYGCAVHPCLNGGNCSSVTSGSRTYRCSCPQGFAGINCEGSIDECGSNPCHNNAPCYDGVGSFYCNCTGLGYYGTLCDQDIDECLNSTVCGTGQCFNNPGSFTCGCQAGFIGPECRDINECQSSPCSHGGTCQNLVNSFKCLCAPGYTGTMCEVDINECVNITCTNRSSCQDLVNGYQCVCRPGYTGNPGNNPNCTEINECASIPCKNGATCVDKVNGFECRCAVGFNGTTCDNNIDDCPIISTCQHGGTCVDKVNNYTCACALGYTGARCETDIDECNPNPCGNNSINCTQGIGTYTCTCKRGYDGYLGLNCSNVKNECGSSPCQNGGTCHENNVSYTCECDQRNASVPGTNRTYLTGYTGTNCETDINECLVQPSICLNGGYCDNENGTFQCKCGRDNTGNYYSGAHCEIQTSYCIISSEVKDDPPACWHNGTCTGLTMDFRCTCAPGYTGKRCKTDINECDSSPCQYNGTCNDKVNGYTCGCIPGITGTFCEVNINECESQPCLNGGQCIDGINRFECNCTDTGFKNTTCNVNIDDCEPQPCQNGATCHDLIKDYNCSCNNGYEGKECHVDINECASTPCFYNSPCLQKSNRTYYGPNGHPLFRNMTFSYDSAAGYLCDCVSGSTGTNCETNIDDCIPKDVCHNGTCQDLLNDIRCECYKGFEGDRCQYEINECLRYSPCQHGSTCTDKVADYDCKCPEFYNGKRYAGKNCTFELTACASNQCKNGASCKPYLINETQGLQNYECFCTEGFTGRYCNISTSMSFDTGSNIYVKLNESNDVTVSFRFRTTLQNSILFTWIGQNNQSRPFMTVELKDGYLGLGYYANVTRGFTSQLVSSKKLNDANKHTVLLTKTSTSLSVNVTGNLCPSGCMISVNYDPTVQATPDSYFGSLQPQSLFLQTLSQTKFVGWMEDVTVWGTRLHLNLVTANHNFTNLTEGCPRSVQCYPNTCNTKGACVDLWNKFRCDCYRPNLGTTCDKAYVAATFAHNDITSSTAEFNVSALSSNLSSKMNMSFFIRTRQKTSLIIFFGNLSTTFLTIGLENGHLKMRLKFCDFEQTFITNGDVYNDGKQYLIDIQRNAINFTLSVNKIIILSENLIPSECAFNALNLYFGGKTPGSVNGRKKRETTVILNQPIGDFSATIPYKGTIQDVQLNDYSLQFYPLSDPTLSSLTKLNTSSSSGLTQNEETDHICNRTSPCENNSTCTDVFFNDYRCDCRHGYRGKNCSELDFCVTGKCPDGSTCHSLLDGFECISSATFGPNSQNHFATYTNTLMNSSHVQEFSFKFRTLALNGYIFMIGNSSRYYKARLVGGVLKILYKLDDLNEMSLTAGYPVNDSRWYFANVTEYTDTVTLTLSYENEVYKFVNINESRSLNSDTLDGLLKFVGNKVSLGKNVSGVNSRNSAYHGCLKELRIGGILLPFFTDEQFVNNTSKERFLLQPIHSFAQGCQTTGSCTESQCRNSAVCIPDFYTYTCNCTDGYAGHWCQDRMNYCTGGPCLHGQCVSTTYGYMCRCPVGYTGTRCETDLDECSSGPCQNGGTCRNLNGTFSCNCLSQFLGDTCNISLNENCSSNPCVNGSCQSVNKTVNGVVIETFNCSCLAGYEGYKCADPINYCSSFPCQNGGNCTSSTNLHTFQCTCPQGFTGSGCETNINDCFSGYCRNGGECVDGVNTFACNCTPSVFYTGSNCMDDIDECVVRDPCQNGGLCYNRLGSPGFECSCGSTGFNGQYCENDVDECSYRNTCKHGASCTNTVGSYQCNCTTGYREQDCGIADCNLVTCLNGATCQVNDTKTEWTCHCPQYYEGQFCQIKGPCAYRPCVEANPQTCTQNISSNTYTCNCLTGWTGQFCNEDVDECQTNTDQCQNGATCGNTAGSYTCACPPGFTDRFCEININECSPNPCQNGGYCIDSIAEYECNCTGTGYQNLTCSVDVDECTDNDPCYNGATCTNTIGSYSCKCSDGYEGPRCEVKSEEVMDEDITWYIVGPVVAVVLIIITIAIIWFLLCVRNKRATRGVYSPSRQEVTGSRVELGNVMKKPPLERLI